MDNSEILLDIALPFMFNEEIIFEILSSQDKYAIFKESINLKYTSNIIFKILLLNPIIQYCLFDFWGLFLLLLKSNIRTQDCYL